MTLLRSALFNAWFFGITVLLGLVGLVVRWLAPRRALPFARFWVRLVLAGARHLCGIEVAVTGLERLPDGPLLLASQHQSAFDTLVWATLLPRFAYIYKAELARIPLFGPMLPATGQIPIDRAASLATVRQLLKATQAAKAAGRQIIIFPEGTRLPVGAEGPIRSGFTVIAARTGLPVYPVATDSGRCWGRRAFSKRPGTIHIHIGEPIPSDLPPLQLIDALRERWRAANLGVNPVDNPVDGPVTTPSRAVLNPADPTAFDPSHGPQEDRSTPPRARPGSGK